MASRIRLFFDGTFDLGETIEIQENQFHYLKNVLRLDIGDTFNLFNGRDGEFLFEIKQISKNSLFAAALKKTEEQFAEPDIWLLFAPIKRHRIDMLVEKITELGVAKFVPVVTEYSNINKLNIKKLRLRAIEAAEQSLRMTIPQIEEITKFEKILEGWDFSRRLLVLDEFLASNRHASKRGLRMSSLKLESDLPTKIAIFVGPEGGFSPQERELLIKCDFAWNIYLGSRLLRSETAAIAAMAIWNELSDSKH